MGYSYEWIAHQLKELDRSHGLFSFDSEPLSGILLRHDVDLDVRPALEMALLERAHELKGTYFFLTTAQTYNPASKDNKKMIEEIASLGFEIGLHFDASAYVNAGIADLLQAAEREATHLEHISGQHVSSVSLHNPSVNGDYPMIAGFRNAYDARIFGPDCFLSDSRMIFHTEPKVFFQGMAREIGQLLLHPIHYSEDGSQYPHRMKSYIRRFVESINENLSVNSTFRRQAPNGLSVEVRW